MKDEDTVRKCSECSNVTNNVWTGFCSDECYRSALQKAPQPKPIFERYQAARPHI